MPVTRVATEESPEWLAHNYFSPRAVVLLSLYGDGVAPGCARLGGPCVYVDAISHGWASVVFSGQRVCPACAEWLAAGWALSWIDPA